MADSTQIRAVGLLPAVDEACRRVEGVLDVPPDEAQRLAIRDALRALAWSAAQATAPLARLVREGYDAAREGARARLGSAAPMPTAAELRRALAERVATAPAEEVRVIARSLGLPLADG